MTGIRYQRGTYYELAWILRYRSLSPKRAAAVSISFGIRPCAITFAQLYREWDAYCIPNHITYAPIPLTEERERESTPRGHYHARGSDSRIFRYAEIVYLDISESRYGSSGKLAREQTLFRSLKPLSSSSRVRLAPPTVFSQTGRLDTIAESGISFYTIALLVRSPAPLLSVTPAQPLISRLQAYLTWISLSLFCSLFSRSFAKSPREVQIRKPIVHVSTSYHK